MSSVVFALNMYQPFSKIACYLISRQTLSPVSRITFQPSYLARRPKKHSNWCIKSLIGFCSTQNVVCLTLGDTSGLWTHIDVEPDNVFIIFRDFFLQTIMDKTLETLYQISTYSGYLNTPLPHFNVVNVAMWSKQSRVNCKPQETTLSGGRGGLNILYPLVSQDIRKKCVIFVCFNYFCPWL